MHIKGFTLIELLIVIAIVGILAGIVIVSLSGNTSAADDVAKKANLRSVATLYAEVFATNGGPDSLCVNDKAQAAMNAIFVGTPTAKAADSNTSTGNGGQDQYTDGALGAETKNGCVSNSSGDWVVWADLSSDDGVAWCIDSRGKNGEFDANAGAVGAASDTYSIEIAGNGTSRSRLNGIPNKISCNSIK